MSDILFIEARKKFNLDEVDFSKLDSLPDGEISLAATVQYLGLIKPVKEYLESVGKKVSIRKGAYYEGHVLGCNPSAFDKSKELLLLLCDGQFHALNNSIILDKPIYVFNTRTLEKVDDKDLENYRKRKKSKQMKFLQEDKIGLIVSTKVGQKCLNCSGIKNKIEKLGKKVYLFESDDINVGELENFNDIKIWVNTACFGLALDDHRIINFNDVLEFL
jgi:diphthamide biosynthesis enzyme Dph1/Dph2-like protein